MKHRDALENLCPSALIFEAKLFSSLSGLRKRSYGSRDRMNDTIRWLNRVKQAHFASYDMKLVIRR